MLTISLHARGTHAERVSATDTQHASQLFTAWIDENGFGASDLGADAGIVRDAAGKKVARISYNGRVWEK